MRWTFSTGFNTLHLPFVNDFRASKMFYFSVEQLVRKRTAKSSDNKALTPLEDKISARSPAEPEKGAVPTSEEPDILAKTAQVS